MLMLSHTFKMQQYCEFATAQNYLPPTHCFKTEIFVKIAAGSNFYVIILHTSKYITQLWYHSYDSLFPYSLLTQHLCTGLARDISNRIVLWLRQFIQIK
jgi:hypothetical protein